MAVILLSIFYCGPSVIMDRVKLLIITETFFPDTIGGAGRVAMQLSYHLAGQGHEVRVVTRETSRAHERDETRDGYRIFRFAPDFSSPAALYTSTHRGVRDAIDRATARWRPDLINMEQPHAGYHSLNHPALEGVRRVYTLYSSWADELRVKGGWYRVYSFAAEMIEKSLLRRCGKIVVLSEFTRKRAAAIAPRVPITILPGGVDISAFTMKAPRPQNDPPVLITVRNLVRRMGIDILIDAVEILRLRGRRVRLKIAGRGILESELKGRAKALGDDCEFLGFVSEDALPRLYREADLFLLPTVAIEGFGLVILEAFASGTPVVGTPVGAIEELVGLQGSGYVSKSATAADLADAIQFNLERRDLIQPEALRGIAEQFLWSERAKVWPSRVASEQ